MHDHAPTFGSEQSLASAAVHFHEHRNDSGIEAGLDHALFQLVERHLRVANGLAHGLAERRHDIVARDCLRTDQVDHCRAGEVQAVQAIAGVFADVARRDEWNGRVRRQWAAVQALGFNGRHAHEDVFHEHAGANEERIETPDLFQSLFESMEPDNWTGALVVLGADARKQRHVTDAGCFHAAGQGFRHPILVRAKIVGGHVGRDEQVGCFGAGQGFAHQALVFQVADKALGARLRQYIQLFAVSGHGANLFPILQEVGRCRSTRITRGSEYADHERILPGREQSNPATWEGAPPCHTIVSSYGRFHRDSVD